MNYQAIDMRTRPNFTRPFIAMPRGHRRLALLLCALAYILAVAVDWIH